MQFIDNMHWTSSWRRARLGPMMTSSTPARGRTGMPSADRRIAIVPSMLDVDFARLGDEVVALERAGADRLHWDVMDAHFVPRITNGPDILRNVRGLTEMRTAGRAAGVALNPATPIEAVRDEVDLMDLLSIMTVNATECREKDRDGWTGKRAAGTARRGGSV